MRYMPLYDAAQNIKFSELNAPHAGLWFEKFFSDYAADFSKIQEQKQLYQEITQHKALPSSKELENFSKRQTELVKTQGGKTRNYKTQWHFITGMGQNHPIENGFAWHPLLGVPYLAGSGVKGLLRHWVKYYLEDTKLEQEWFGSDDVNNPYIGELIFFDALPTTQPEIIVDIMTPHYGNWYEKGANGRIEDAPHDSHEPVPISFLAVKNATFQISIASRTQSEKSNSAISRAFDELKTALELLGAGAKTGTGYGRFENTYTQEEKAEQYKEHKRLTELEKKQAQEEANAKKEREKKLNRSPFDALFEDVFKKEINKAALNRLIAEPSLYQSLSDEDRLQLINKIEVSPWFKGLRARRSNWRKKLPDLLKK